MKRLLALICVLCCLTGCAGAEKDWTEEEWESVVMALASDEAEPVPEKRRASFRSGWLPAAEKGYINVLLISSDAPDIDQNFGRADAILVCRIDLWTGETRLLSLPEDALVTIAEAPEPVALRYVNCFGGAGLTARCVNDALHLGVSHFCAVNIEAFIAIVDALGGVTMELAEGEAEALELAKGAQKLTGEQALRYVKLRRPGDGSTRVRALLSAVLRETTAGGSVKQVLGLADLLLPSVDTNLTTDDIVDLIFALFGQDHPISFDAMGMTAADGGLNGDLAAQGREFLYGGK
ncbi:MAG: LCP family protein [Clostridia bacterium]|nr:LCP family protein [Clostridia bacterium]